MRDTERNRLDLDELPIRYVIGIDLGTTNCATCFVDLDKLDANDENSAVVETFLIPQGVAPNVLEERPTLPSFFVRTPDAPLAPWEDAASERVDFSAKRKGSKSRDGKYGAVGVLARDYGASEPDSFVCSAKSWLCHSGVDRTAPILPWSPTRSTSEDPSGSTARRWSPVEISSHYLGHIRSAWNARYPDYPLETQSVVLTIPASFDETARTLTLEAAKLAGIPRATLVEEPQAAFYSLLERHKQDWTKNVRPGDKILVCDVGGGTTDFALIYALERDANEKSESSSVRFYRVAVGDHLVLGGDNLDLALYRRLEEKILAKRSRPLTSRERSILLKESRDVKERMLSVSSDSNETRKIVLPGSGSKLVGGGTTVEVERREVESLLVDGFFPRVPFDAAPVRRRSGLREIALPYATDPAITKYLASFLNAHRNAGADLLRAGILGRPDADANAVEDAGPTGVDPARPDAILFNGGAFESPILRERIVESLVDWFDGEKREWRPTVLENDDLYLAVARGAAYYGLVLRGHGTRIGASLARSYYVGVALEPNASEVQGARRKAACLLPAQSEAGDEIVLPRTFELAVDRPASFPIFVSSVRTLDAPGDLIEIDPNETRELAPIRTALKTRSQAKKEAGTVRVRLVARPTEIGTIELYLKEVPPEDAPPRFRASRWTLQFDARGGTQSDWEASDNEGETEGVLDESLVEGARRVLTGVFAPDDRLDGVERVKPGELFRGIGAALGMERDDIPIATLRRLAEATLDLADGRRRTAATEARWLNWLGFALRPGFGAATDDWRVERAWKTVGGRLAFNAPETRTQYWILWRRVASGLTAGRQLALAEPLLASLRALRLQLIDGRGKGPDLDLSTQEGAEIWRALGAFELLPLDVKEEIGTILLDVMPKKKLRPIRSALVWALGRLGSRVMFNAPLDRSVAPSVARTWIWRLLDELRKDGAPAPAPTETFALAQMARKAEDDAFDVDLETREAVAAFLAKYDAEESTINALEKNDRLVDAATRQIFGEALPLGLTWGRADAD